MVRLRGTTVQDTYFYLTLPVAWARNIPLARCTLMRLPLYRARILDYLALFGTAFIAELAFYRLCLSFIIRRSNAVSDEAPGMIDSFVQQSARRRRPTKKTKG